MADGTGTRVVTCLINRWKVRINREELYNVKAYAPKGEAKKRKVPKKGKGRIRTLSSMDKIHGQP